MDNKLVLIKGNDIFTDSWIISENIERDHKRVTETIQRYEKDLSDLGQLIFSAPSGNKNRGRERKAYLLNEEQSIFLMTLFDNSPIVLEFKKSLAREFVKMRRFILEKQSAEWQQARLTGKQIRKDETDIILTKLIPHAESQGSHNAGKLYLTYSKLVNMTLNIEAGQRNNLPLAYIDSIKFLERAIENIISIEVDKGTNYKEIYQVCKAKCQIIKDLSFLPELKLISA
jgi:phage regulator Rha-like protein